jgi:hypothetical protein
MKLKTLRLFVLACAFAAFVTCSAQAPQAGEASPDAIAQLSTQMRLRKLHLVRPDLIHYPLQLEIVC